MIFYFVGSFLFYFFIYFFKFEVFYLFFIFVNGEVVDDGYYESFEEVDE